MGNIRFNYMYRDAGNYKKFGSVVFSNPELVTLQSLAAPLAKAFSEEGLFVAHQIRVPEVFFYTRGNATSDDHFFHEFDGVEESLEAPNDQLLRSVGEFLVEVQRQAKRGWIPFDPHEVMYKRLPTTTQTGT
jgi:hypothetical protein